MLQMSAAEFRTKCLKLMDDAKFKNEVVIITKRGKPIAKLIPYEEKPLKLYGWMAGTIETCGDIVSPTGAFDVCE